MTSSATNDVTGFFAFLIEVFLSVNINECAPAPCLNDGSCTDLVNAFLCACAPGYEGARCQIETDECEEVFGTDLGCLNGATCVDRIAHFTCDCAPGFDGARCQSTAAL